MSIKDELKEQFKEFPGEIRQRFVNTRNEELDEYCNYGFQLCMIKMLDLLIDSELSEEDIVKLLQLHFDLRLSEAKNLIQAAKNRKIRDKR